MSSAVPLVALAGVGLLSCSGSLVVPPTPTSLRIGVATPSQAAPGSGLNLLVDLLSLEPLVSVAADGREFPRLAHSWSWEEGHRRLIVRLEKDVVFHDGTPLTSELVATVLRASVASGQFPSFSSIVNVVANADDTVELRLRTPDSFVLPDLAWISLARPQKPHVGTGPYQLQAGKERDAGVLTAFNRYHQGRPSITRIEIGAYATQRKAWAAMMRGEIDMVYDACREGADFIEAETTVKMFSFPRAYYVPLVFNVRHPVLRNPEIRRALNMAVDKAAAVRDGLRNRGRPAESPVWPEHWANDQSYRSFSFDPDAARAALDRAGVPVTRSSPSAMPSRFSFTCLVFANDARFERLALVLQKQLFDVGVEMKLEPVSLAQLAARAAKGDFDAFLSELASVRSLSYVYYFWHSPRAGSLFDSGYIAADSALEHMRQATSDAETRAATADLLRVFRNDPPAIFVAWQEQARAVSARFEVPDAPQRDIIGSIWQWRVRPASQVQAAR